MTTLGQVTWSRLLLRRRGGVRLGLLAALGAALVVGTGFTSSKAPPKAACAGKPATIAGTQGADTLTGTPGNDVIAGLRGNDTIDGGGGDDVICGGDGNDFLLTAAGNDRLDGGNGSDVHKVWTTAGTTVVADTGSSGTDYVKFFGSTGADTITLTPGAATGGTMSATYTGIDGYVVVYADGDVSGGSTGPGGNDVVDAATLTVATQLFGQAGDDTLTGGLGSDGLSGGDGTDSLSGGAGNDTLNGVLGADTLAGGGGDDTFSGSAGDDAIDGGGGADLVLYSLAPGPVSVDLTAAIASGAWGDDTLTGIENITGSDFADTLNGGPGPNVLGGGKGDDTIDARDGAADTVDGGPGEDKARVDKGKDRVRNVETLL